MIMNVVNFTSAKPSGIGPDEVNELSTREFTTAQPQTPMKIKGQCKCISVQFESQEAVKIWGVFYCHCSRCPVSEVETHNGIGWVGLPRPRYTGPLLVGSSSPFATRGFLQEL